MKALTLWQPFAMFIEKGCKEVETRSWYTDYRGPLAIHAAKRWTRNDPDIYRQILSNIGEIVDAPPFTDVEADHGRWKADSFGCVVAICELAACMWIPEDLKVLQTNALALIPEFKPRHGWEIERIVGGYDFDRYAWILRNVKPVIPHIPAKGNRQLWNWDPPGKSSTVKIARLQT